MKGKLIVIEGTDGSGKATQVELLAKRLKQEGKKVRMLDFPRYGKPSAYFVEKYLRGEYGKVGPYKASLFYALDRYDTSFELKKWLQEGYIVLSDRYASANMGHQAGKIKSPKEREYFEKWLTNLEYEIFSIPKPDLTILLAMPPEVGQKLVDKKAKRKYLNGVKRDIHENDLKHLQNAFQSYLEIAKKYRWAVISCVEKGKLLSREEVRKKVLASTQSLFK